MNTLKTQDMAGKRISIPYSDEMFETKYVHHIQEDGFPLQIIDCPGIGCPLCAMSNILINLDAKNNIIRKYIKIPQHHIKVAYDNAEYVWTAGSRVFKAFRTLILDEDLNFDELYFVFNPTYKQVFHKRYTDQSTSYFEVSIDSELHQLPVNYLSDLNGSLLISKEKPISLKDAIKVHEENLKKTEKQSDAIISI